MTTPTQAAMTIEGFAHQVEREFADLPQPVRNRLMADLDAHLRELAEHGDLLATVGRPEDYARDLREALELPGGSAGGSAPSLPRLRPRWLVPVLAGAGVAVIAGTLILIFALTGAGSTSVVVPAASDVAGPTVSLNLLPNLVGETADVATTQLRSLGFAMRIVTDPPSTATPGTVVAQDPATPGSISITLPQGSTVTLHVAG